MQNAPSTKRVRRPNVRLNEPYYDNPGHRKLQQKWNAFKKDLELAQKARNKKNNEDKTINVDVDVDEEDDDDDDDDDVAIGKWKNFGNGVKDLKSKGKRKRVLRPSSSSKKWGDGEDQENGGLDLSSGGESEKKQGGELGVDGNSESKNSKDSEPSEANGVLGDEKLSDEDDDDNNVGGGDEGKGKRKRGRESMNGRVLDGVGGKARKVMAGGSDGDKGGVRGWLDGLRLSKYAPLFEVHEVDDEVLPFLTLEDLKDMGVNAVGSRRKMYCSIQKLGKGF